MPQIRQYNPQVAPAGPVNMPQANAEQMGAGVGEAIQHVGQEIGQFGPILHQRAVDSDRSNIDTQMALIKNDLSLQMQDQLQKGVLNHDDFMKSAQHTIESIGDQVDTREGRQLFSKMQAQTSLELSTAAQRGQAELEGVKAVQNARTAMDARTSYVMGNPGNFQATLTQSNQSIDDMVATGGLPALKAPELKRMAMDQLAAGALRGIMRANPDEAQAQLDSGQWDQYMGENTKYKMEIETNHFKSARLTDEKRAQDLKDKKESAIQEATAVGYVARINDPHGPGLAASDVVKDMQEGKIDSGTAEKFIKMIQSEQQEKKLKSDPHIFNQLAHDLTRPDGDPQKITDMREINKHIGIDISAQDVSTLYGLLGEKHTPQGEADSAIQKQALDQVKNTLIKNPMMPDPDGMKLYTDVQAQAYEYSLKAAQQGKSKTQIWSPVINGKPNPDYVFNHVAVPQRSFQDIIQSTTKMYQRGSNGKVVEPRKSGESIDDYLKRSGGNK